MVRKNKTATSKYLPKPKHEIRFERFLVRLSRRVNPVLAKFRRKITYRNGEWKISKFVPEDRRLQSVISGDMVRWSLKDCKALRMDEGIVNAMIDKGDSESVAGSKRKKKKRSKRRYLSPGTRLEDFFRRLNDLGVRYAVLRWFEDLPHLAEGEDIDMLFGDEAAAHFDDLFLKSKVKGAIPFDIYTEGGLPGSNFESLPYYEGRLAKEILDNTVLHKGFVKVPDTRRHFLSLAYHVVYHKAHASGLPFKDGEPPIVATADHDYAQVLKDLAQQLDIDFEPTLLGLSKILADNGWSPAMDTIRKLSLRRPVLQCFLDENHAFESPSICTLLVRQWAFDRGLLPWICANLRAYGFDLKLVKVLDDAEKARAAQSIRGGNWNQGPYPVSGGPPAAMIVACDYTPSLPDDETRLDQPFARNQRFVSIKKMLRVGVNRHLPAILQVNAIHSADDNSESFEYIKRVCPDELPEIEARIKSGYEGDPYLKLFLQTGRRASSYIVYHDGRPCILKVFSDCEDGKRALANERLAAQRFANCDWAPNWIAFGTNWMIQEFFQQDKRLDREIVGFSKQSRTKLAGEVVKIAEDIHKAGFAHRDFHAENMFLINGHIKLIDFETLAFQDKKVPLRQSYDITGEGLAPPFGNKPMCYEREWGGKSLKLVLGVSADEAFRAAFDEQPVQHRQKTNSRAMAR